MAENNSLRKEKDQLRKEREEFVAQLKNKDEKGEAYEKQLSICRKEIRELKEKNDILKVQNAKKEETIQKLMQLIKNKVGKVLRDHKTYYKSLGQALKHECER